MPRRPCHGNANEHALRARNSARIMPLRQQLATRRQLRFGRSAVWIAIYEMALEVESVLDGGVHAEEALRGSSRLEALQLALASSHRLVRVLRGYSCAALARAGRSGANGGTPRRRSATYR